MYFTGIGDFKTFINRVISRIETGIFQVKSLFEVVESIPQLIGLPEEAGIIIEGNGSETVIIFGEEFGLFEEFLAELEVFLLEVGH